MDPMNIPEHSDASPVISGGCNRQTDCARTPIFAEERGELLREVTPQPAVHRPSQATTTSPSLEVPLLPKER